ncbi:hypothetical protein PEP31012_00927 [Pandoraea eparura]|uniref:Uncharacterized protein n=1 Tax=Pandoraea eparura TaxID=2508291 RepID=A0A5E4SPP2_9BURK|nr:hypothetical protein [Pandoraea eparura]VVD77667.1 hypothetical protein PEP31012_00927 [Pandoraea eparura]
MRLPFALAALDWIAPRDVQGARIALDLDGQRGWTCPVVGGYVVATALTLPTAHRQTHAHVPSRFTSFSTSRASSLIAALGDDPALARWITRLSLVLAGQPALRDDNLCLANETLWWVHRFDASEPTACVEAQLRRQLLACTMVTSQGLHAAAPASDRSHTAGHPAGPADVSRRLQALRRG